MCSAAPRAAALDILKELQRDGSKVDVKITDDDPQDVRDVDSKLVRLAHKYTAKNPLRTTLT